MHLGCLAARIEAQIHGLSSRLTSSQTEVATEKEKAKEAVQELEFAQAIIVEKEKEVQ